MASNVERFERIHDRTLFRKIALVRDDGKFQHDDWNVIASSKLVDYLIKKYESPNLLFLRNGAVQKTRLHPYSEKKRLLFDLHIFAFPEEKLEEYVRRHRPEDFLDMTTLLETVQTPSQLDYDIIIIDNVKMKCEDGLFLEKISRSIQNNPLAVIVFGADVSLAELPTLRQRFGFNCPVIKAPDSVISQIKHLSYITYDMRLNYMIRVNTDEPEPFSDYIYCLNVEELLYE